MDPVCIPAVRKDFQHSRLVVDIPGDRSRRSSLLCSTTMQYWPVGLYFAGAAAGSVPPHIGVALVREVVNVH